MDTISSEKRSWNMSRIRSADTKPEKIVRSILHSNGLRYRLHPKSVLGRPDIVLSGLKLAIFIHGCFWHRHKECKYAYNPKSRVDFWNKKFSDNVKRYKFVAKSLKKAGWKVITIWECEIENSIKLERHVHRILSLI